MSDDDNNVNVKFGADTASLVSGTNTASAAVKDLSKDFEKTTATASSGATALAGSMQAVSSASVVSAQGMQKVESAVHGAGVVTAGATRELIVLAHEMVQGNFSRIPGSMMVMAERVGGLHTAVGALIGFINPLNVGLAAVGFTLVAVAVHAQEAAETMAKVRVAFASTGNEYLFDPARVEEMTKALEDLSGVGAKDAKAMMLELSGAVNMTNAELETIRGSLPDLVTKFGSAEAAGRGLKMAIDDPAGALHRFHDEMARNNPALLDAAQNFLIVGDKASATAKILEYLTESAKGLHDKGLTPLGQAWEFVKENMQAFIGASAPLLGLLMQIGTGAKNAGADVMILADAFGKVGKGVGFGQALNAAKLDKSGQTYNMDQSIAYIESQKKLNAAVAEGDDLVRKLGNESVGKLSNELVKLKTAMSAAQAGGDPAEVEKFSSAIAAVQKKQAAELLRQETAALADKRGGRIADLNEARTFAQQEFAIEEEKLKMKRSAGQISSDQEMQALVQLKQREYQVELKALQDEAALWRAGSKEYKKVQDDIVLLKQKTELSIQKITAQSLQQQQQKWSGFFSGIKSSFNSSIIGLIQGTTTFGQAAASVFMSLGQSVAGVLEDMAEKWLINEIIGETSAKTQAMTAIAGSAAQAGAAAYASTAAIPIVGPSLAPAAAATAYSGAMAYEGLASFDIGSWNVPGDMAANIHKGEMILPKPFADSVREGGGMGGGDVHLHLSAIDGSSAKRFIKDNASEIAKAITGQHRNFNPAFGGT